jgi:hypothetical protein
MHEKQKYLLLKDLSNAKILGTLKQARAVIAGGAVRAVFAGEHISDYDVYFKNVNGINQVRTWLDNNEFVQFAVTPNAESYSKNSVKIQLITMPSLACENSTDIIKQFDYSVCMGAFDVESDTFVLDPLFLEDVSRRELRFNITSKYPISSLFRLRKYLKKGYSISGIEMVKLGCAINNLQMKSYRDLRDQLQGIDTLFLMDLTNKLGSSEYGEKEYNFAAFTELLDQYAGDKLDEVFE